MKRLIVGFLALAFLVPLSSLYAEEGLAQMPAWNMRVKMVITDTCRVNCPCLFGLDPDHGHCRWVGAMHIVKGNYGDIPLDGVTWGALGEFTGSRKDQKWLYTAYYIDKDSSKAQQEALRSILSAPPFSKLGEQLGIKVVDVKIEVPDSPVGMYTLNMGNLGKIRVRPAIGNDPNTPQKVLNPVYPFPVKEIAVGTAVGKFSDHGKDMNLNGKDSGSGEIGEFVLSGGGR